MNKKTLIIAVLPIFVLIISAVNVAEAQYDIPDPTPSQVPMNNSAPVINSPRELCQFYNSRPERSIFIGAVGNSTEDDCLYRISDGMGNDGFIHGYYSGSQFCTKSYGAYFNNAGVPDKTECKAAPQMKKAQPQKNPPKIPVPVKPVKKPDASDNRALNDLSNLNDLGNKMSNFVNQAAENLRSFFDSLFNGAKRFFRIKT